MPILTLPDPCRRPFKVTLLAGLAGWLASCGALPPAPSLSISVLRKHSPGGSGLIRSVRYSPDGRTIAAWTHSGWADLTLIDANSGKELPGLAIKKHPPGFLDSYAIQMVAFSPDGRRIAASRSCEYVNICNLTEGQVSQDLRNEYPPELREGDIALGFDYEGGNVYALAWSPCGKMLVTGDAIGTIAWWDVETGKRLRHNTPYQHIPLHERTVLSLAFNPRGTLLAAALLDTSVMILDSSTARERIRLWGHRGMATCVAFSPDGKTPASGSADNTVILWDAGKAAQRLRLNGHRSCITALAFSPDGRWLATCSLQGYVRIWDVSTGREIQALQEIPEDSDSSAPDVCTGPTPRGLPPEWVSSIDFSPDATRLASGEWDGDILIRQITEVRSR